RADLLAVEHFDAVLRNVRAPIARSERIQDRAPADVEPGRALVAEQRTGIGEHRALQAQIPRQAEDRELNFESAAEIGRAADGVGVYVEARNVARADAVGGEAADERRTHEEVVDD